MRNVVCPFCDSQNSALDRYCYSCGAELGTGVEVISVPQDMIAPTPQKRGSLGDDYKSSGGSLGSSYKTSSGGYATVGAGYATAVPGGAFPSGNDPNALSQVSGWNWGAFVFSWIWCFAHNLAQLGVISLIAGFFNMGLFASIYVGIKGNEEAWKHRRFSSVQEFRDVQKKWSIAGLILMFFIFGFIILAVGADILNKM